MQGARGWHFLAGQYGSHLAPEKVPEIKQLPECIGLAWRHENGIRNATQEYMTRIRYSVKL
jgi:hypothetical protein